jgi:hypothetical protein
VVTVVFSFFTIDEGAATEFESTLSHFASSPSSFASSFGTALSARGAHLPEGFEFKIEANGGWIGDHAPAGSRGDEHVEIESVGYTADVSAAASGAVGAAASLKSSSEVAADADRTRSARAPSGNRRDALVTGMGAGLVGFGALVAVVALRTQHGAAAPATPMADSMEAPTGSASVADYL